MKNTELLSPHTDRKLEALLADVLALSALPTVANTLSNVLFDMLHVELVYVCLTNGSPVEAVRIDGQAYSAGQALDLGRMIRSHRTHYSAATKSHMNDADNIRHVVVPMGLEGRCGMVLCASHQSDFPTEFDSLRIGFAVTQAILGLKPDQSVPPKPAAIGIHHALPVGQGLHTSIRPVDTVEHWHANFLEMTPHGIQLQGTVEPARGVMGRYRMTPAELKTCLKQLDWTQEKLANAFHVSQSTVKKWAQGRTKIPGPAIVLIKLMLENSAYLHKHRVESLPQSFQ